MKKRYKISIPEPCSEDWHKMPKTEQGRFCGVCAKNLIDFTNKSAIEIQEILQKNTKNKVCGRFTVAQLDTIHIEIPAHTFRKQYSFARIFAISLLLAMGTTLLSCNSDGKIKKIESVTIVKNSDTTLNEDDDNDGIPNEFDVDYIELSQTKSKVSKKTIKTCKTDSLKKKNLLKIKNISKKRKRKKPDVTFTTHITGVPVYIEPDPIKIPKLPLEQTLKKEIELLALGGVGQTEITKHFCNSNPRILVNNKTILFSNFYENIKGKRIKIKEFNIFKNDRNCISSIKLKYRMLYRKHSIPNEIKTLKDSVVDTKVTIKKKDTVVKEINSTERTSKPKDIIKEK